jgi:anaphase-promoting complex subunit 3
MKQEKYEMAQLHFERAMKINPLNPLTHLFLGQAHASLKQHDKALKHFDSCISLRSDNPIAKLHRANALIALTRYHVRIISIASYTKDALEELKILEKVAPRESSVQIALGRVLAKLKMTREAILHLSMVPTSGLLQRD